MPSTSSTDTAGNGESMSGWPRVTAARPSDSDERDPFIARAQVGEEHAVDATLRGQLAVRVGFERAGRHRCEHERLPGGREFPLDPGDERREERVSGDDLDVAPQHEAQRERAIGAEGASPKVGRPAHLGGDGEDALAGRDVHARPIVQRERDQALADAGALSDVGDGRSSTSTRVRFVAHSAALPSKPVY